MTSQVYSLPIPSKRRISTLTADAGFGHRSAANAVASAMQEKYGEFCKIDIVNPLEDKRTPFFLRDSQSDYDKLVRSVPELYRFGYDASDATVPVVIAEQALTVLMFDVMRDVLRTYRPDVVLSTYPLYQPPMRAAMTMMGYQVPLLVVVTDLATVHRLWFSNSMDMCFVPNNIVRDLALGYGIAPEHVLVTGIPVNPEIVRDQRSPAEIRILLDLHVDLPTILAIGSRRVDNLVETLNILNHFGSPLQLIVVAGKDVALYRQLKAVEWHVPVKLYDYARNIPTLMKASDWIICKAGGLVVTESLASGKPILLIDAIPGQETGNASYVVENGAGDLALDSIEVLETTYHWLANDHRLLRERTENARRLGQPNAAYDVVDFVWFTSQRRVTDHSRSTGRLRLMNWLSKNQVHWEDED